MQLKSTEEKIVEEPVKRRNRSKAAEDKEALSSTKKNVSPQAKKNPPLTDYDIYLFHEGKHYECYKFMGAHYKKEGRRNGVRFTIWAPKAKNIKIVGSFNDWSLDEGYDLEQVNDNGLWSLFVPGIKEGELYKLAITLNDDKVVLKSDPYGFFSEKRPNNASKIVKDINYTFSDEEWIEKRKSTNIYKSPVNIYEVHLGSWRRNKEGEFLTYRELAELLPKYAKDMGYTHIELMPIMEHPLDDSWGYQVTGYYAVTSRFGTPQDFKYLVDCCHKEGLGVILDWVPGHFCKDEHGLYRFDGTPTYEYEDETKAENRGWGAANFDLGRPEIRSFLISNALYWLREFHIDGLRVDAVANMLYLDYGRKQGEWRANKYGSNENIEAIGFLRELNSAIFKEFSNILIIAEESTSWPMVTKPTDIGGLGFNFKWNMGWMNDMLKYVQLDPIYRKNHHNQITFSMMYNHSENFILPISHDEVVHGKKSLVDKMWGDYWNKFAGLRAFAGYMFAHPGKKTLFMGNEFAQFIEWRHYEELEWKLIEQFDMHRKTQHFFKALNYLYKEEKALWELDYNQKGFQWIDADNAQQSILVFTRNTEKPEETLVVVCNFTPVVYYDFNIGVPYLGDYEEIFNSDSEEFGGSNQIMDEALFSKEEPCHNQKYTLTIKVPPMAITILKVKSILQEEV
ncbi:1,4-alpha-glucan branching protein GlgB [Desnuesiella massiliensis]|uniref:1,4-alpha-glucan branching protein GlgB n=1 Tax=Desnuesiella massiliensis TaxID=1650662 RepID=UPI0009EC81EA